MRVNQPHGWTFALIPFAAGLVGASLATGRRGGFTLTILSRGVTRGQYEILAASMLEMASAALFAIHLMARAFATNH